MRSSHVVVVLVVALLAVVVPLSTGCRTTARDTGWVAGPEILPAEEADWYRLPSSYYGVVAPAMRTEAVEALREQPAVALEPGEVSRWLGAPVEPPQPGLQPFLVRGVAYGRQPLWVDVWVNRESGQLWVDQATFAEPTERTAQDTLRVPLVAYLDQEPPQVCSTARSGTGELLWGRGCAAMLGGRATLTGPADTLLNWRANLSQY